jgi:histone H3/H4
MSSTATNNSKNHENVKEPNNIKENSDTTFQTYPLDKIMKDIESDTEKRLEEAKKKAHAQPVGEVLVSIMQKGADEFKEKMGRNMTYSEMRQMYG